MENFLISIEGDKSCGFVAQFAGGQSVELSASNYADAVVEADLLDETDYA